MSLQIHVGSFSILLFVCLIILLVCFQPVLGIMGLFGLFCYFMAQREKRQLANKDHPK